jgi:small subunit ribosomal protein S8
MMTDPIADMLTRIRNGYAAQKKEVVLPISKIKFRIAEILRDAGFVESVEKIEDRFGSIRIGLKYNKHREPALRSIGRVSKPGFRRYAKKDELPVVENDYGIAILSTSQGLMTNKQARKAKCGGEIICFVS